MKQLNRREAIDAGAMFYTGKVCLRGHRGGRRYTRSARCVECTHEDKARDLKTHDEARAALAARHAAA